MLESILFLGWLVAVASVIVWAAQNDQQERQNLLSSIFSMSRPTSRSNIARDQRLGRQRARLRRRA